MICLLWDTCFLPICSLCFYYYDSFTRILGRIEVFNLNVVQYISFFKLYLLWPKKPSLNWNHEDFYPFRNFILLSLFSSMMHFIKFLYIMWVIGQSSFFSLFSLICPIFQESFTEKTVLSPLNNLGPLSHISWPRVLVSFWTVCCPFHRDACLVTSPLLSWLL